MKDYWRHYFDSNADRFAGSQFKQVGKVVNGQEVDPGQLKIITETIRNALELNINDSVVDLCCGNGLLTRPIASTVREVIGVDFSDNLIAVARKCNACGNVVYLCADIDSLDTSFFRGRKKLYMYEGLQHLGPDQLAKLLQTLKMPDEGNKLYLGGIPDKQKLTDYYDTPAKYAYYLQCEEQGSSHMGRWWLKDEIDAIAEERGFRTLHLPQSTALYTSYYRFDCLVVRKP